MSWLVRGALIAALCVGSLARAGTEEAKAYYERGLSAFALGHYAEAAEAYEKAFALKADSALLYNAAQAHRLGGNKQRALLLYENYLRLFGKVPNREEVQRHIAALRAAIASEEHASTAPPTEPAPIGRPPAARTESQGAPEPAAANTTAAAAASPSGASESLTAAPPARPERKRKGWVIGVAVGAAVAAAALAVGLGVGLSSGASDPSPTFGAARLH